MKLKYNQRISEAGQDEFMRGRAAEWVVESALRITN